MAEPSTDHSDDDRPRPNWWGQFLFLLLGVGLLNAWWHMMHPPLDRVRAGRTDLLGMVRILDGRPVLEPPGGQVTYRVELNDVPWGGIVYVRCDWLDPQGNVAETTGYATSRYTAPTRLVEVARTFPPDSEPGLWTVRLTLEDRPLAETPFEVRTSSPRGAAP
jgi:hypothetical protein